VRSSDRSNWPLPPPHVNFAEFLNSTLLAETAPVMPPVLFQMSSLDGA